MRKSLIIELPKELVEQVEIIAGYARTEELDFYQTIFEMLDYDQINQVAAYGGFPQRYPHWRFGMEYERLNKQHSYGLGKIYEMVINNDPCYAYLLADNAMVDQKTVIAHVYGHCDFFKNNTWFSKTNRRMMDDMANHATRIRRHIERQGYEEVEQFIDTCLSLENLIDPHSVFMARKTPSQKRPATEKGQRSDRDAESQVTRYPSKGYMDSYINPPEKLKAEREKIQKELEEEKERDVALPARDILGYLLRHAPLEDWQSDILSIIREEAYYFAPQGQTKVMNEGWASYWHSTIMTRYSLQADEIISYCDHHSGTLATSPGRMNPYKLGIELFRDIERRWNTGRYGKDYDECEDMEALRNWGNSKPEHERVVGKGSPGREKIFEVRQIFNDVTFLDEFLTPEFVERQRLFHYRQDPATGRMVVVNRDFDKIKRQMLFMLTNHAQPYIYIVDGNYQNRGELYLAHRHIGADLDIQYATVTLKSVGRLWGRPVHLQGRIDDEMVLFSFDGEESKQQKITDDIPSPAHVLN